MRVVAAMSGGVDSSVAAARLVRAGHEVVGVHLSLKGTHAGQGKGCGDPTDADDAARVAHRLGIEFQMWDFAEKFRENVMDYFVDSYARGITPNPCLRCNATIKFAALLDRALEMGFDAVGTGHWARVDPRVPALFRSRYVRKDQSYVLSVLTPQQLSHTMFPLGDVETKADVRTEAAELGLEEVSNKPESTDICFIPDGDTAGFLQRHIGEAPGQIVDESGAVVGEHTGTHQFTIGQRKGLKLGRPTADGRPRYVLDISPVTRTVTVGPRESGLVGRIRTGAANWHIPAGPVEAEVQVRAHGTTIPATLTPDGDGLDAALAAPLAGVAPGQGLVAYRGDRVLVQAEILSTEAA